ncbi:glycosyl hydrolase family 28-related protein [Vagococcus fluvialis]|uniref:glycosyl hydrolase family 28-related protein n=1 Tax=Vagococcus fluvialis TaxID=2738 RepID=UPI003B210F81
MSEETKYTDPTGLDKVDYDQEQVSPEVKKHTKNVRTKMYGRHVRESIARAIEFIDLIAQSALNFAKKAFSKSEDTENRLDNQIRDLTSDSEIIDFRYSKMLKKTFNILKDRGDFWDDEFKGRGVNIKWFGVVGDGVTDDIIAFQKAVDSLKNSKNRVIIVPSGMDIFISDSIKLPSNVKIEIADDSKIRTNRSTNNISFENDDPVKGNKNIFITGGTLLCSPKMFNVRGLRIKDINISSRIFAGYFKDIHEFEFENWNIIQPGDAPNQDGIHIFGPATTGLIKHIRGITHDDMIALNADDSDGIHGDIIDITIDDIHSDNTFNFIRLMTRGSLIDKISISNIKGNTFANGGIEIGAAGKDLDKSRIGTITISDVDISNDGMVADNGNLIIDGNIDNLIVDNIRLRRSTGSKFFHFKGGVKIKNTSLSNIHALNDTGGSILFFIDANIDNFNYSNLIVENTITNSHVIVLFEDRNIGTINGNNSILKNINIFLAIRKQSVVGDINISNHKAYIFNRFIDITGQVTLLNVGNTTITDGTDSVVINSTQKDLRISMSNFIRKNVKNDHSSGHSVVMSDNLNVSLTGDSVVVKKLPGKPYFGDKVIYNELALISKGPLYFDGEKWINMIDKTTYKP